MTIILTSLYAVCTIFYVIISIFIVYHLVKYAVNSELNIVMLPLFIIVSIGLLIPNLILFLSLDWDFLLPNISFSLIK